VFLLASLLAISLHNRLFPSTRSANANTYGARGTSCCVLLLQVLCRMKKLLSGVKRACSSDPSSRGSGSHFSDNGSQDSPRSSSFMASPHETMGSSCYLGHDDVPESTDGNDISIRTTEEMGKYESLRHREFTHTDVYDVNLHERVGLEEELPTILWTVGWGKLYHEHRLDSRLLILEFLMTFKTAEKNRKPFVKFPLFGKSFGCDFSHFNELLDFSKSCIPESSAITNFNKVEFSDAIYRKLN
jgi:hypothetical protein